MFLYDTTASNLEGEAAIKKIPKSIDNLMFYYKPPLMFKGVKVRTAGQFAFILRGFKITDLEVVKV